MSTLNLNCTDRALTVANNTALYSGALNVDNVAVTFDSAWSDYEKTAVFYLSDKNVYHVKLNNDNATIPSEVLATEGYLHIGVFGIKGEERITSSVIKVKVAKGSFTGGVTPSGKDVYSELMASMSNKLDKPTTPGVEGQVLLSDGAGGTTWGDAPSSGDKWRLVNSGSLGETPVLNIAINTDSDGNTFRLKKAKWVLRVNKPVGGIVEHSNTPIINGYGKSAFMNVTPKTSDNADYYMRAYGDFPATNSTVYGGGTVTCDKDNYGCKLYQDYLMEIDDIGLLNITALERGIAYDANGIPYPISSTVGSFTAWQAMKFIQKQTLDGEIIDFSNGITSFEWKFLYNTANYLTWELWGVDME